MKISEVIERLEKIKTENGDLDVVVQYRDSGGAYYGCDSELLFAKAETVEADVTVMRDGELCGEQVEMHNVLVL